MYEYASIERNGSEQLMNDYEFKSSKLIYMKNSYCAKLL
jgi:hypothetical protein